MEILRVTRRVVAICLAVGAAIAFLVAIGSFASGSSELLGVSGAILVGCTYLGFALVLAAAAWLAWRPRLRRGGRGSGRRR